MNRIKTLTLLLMIILSVGISAQNPRSVFTDRPVDEAAIYFTPENFNVKTDGRMDVSDALQEALNRTKQKENGCGILFIPEGVYKLSKTIYIPSGVRIIGYGGKRPVFVLAKQAPGFKKLPGKLQKGNTFLVYRRRLPSGRPYRRCQCRDFLQFNDERRYSY